MAEFDITVGAAIVFSKSICSTDGCTITCEFVVKRTNGHSITLTDVTTSGYTNYVFSINEDDTFYLIKTLPYSFTLTNSAEIRVVLDVDTINAPQFKLQGEDTTDVVSETKTLSGLSFCP